ncbi:MAG: DoxX family protein [Alphaproteobacteria bacterium]|nr:DoxX family protein [Alphaproteobacteria bacterium]NDC56373.1 DoxX family protein [Alphaproteobacteria bacterium]NDG04720.1 DoxX family protein [Alphaproteobacteria bacterium]
MKTLLSLPVLLPKKIASYFQWAGPLVARLTVGYVFMATGWGKLQNLPKVTEFFANLGIPAPEILTPFVAGLECFGGLFLMLGLLTRLSAGGLAVTMIVAILTAKWAEIDSLFTLLGFEETLYLTIFTWLAISGAGKASLDYFLVEKHAPAKESAI